MVNRILPGALALALTLTVVGCPGSKDPKPDSGELSLADYCAEIPAAVDLESACFHFDPAVLGSLVSSCVAMEAEVAAGRLAYRGDRAKACIDAWKVITCEAIDAGVPECAGVLVGTVANGNACLDDFECADGQCLVGASCPGICTAYVGLNGVCSAAGAQCAQGLLCDPNNRCIATTPPAKQGQACATGGCEAGLYCDPGPKTCAPKKKSGSCAGAPDACAVGYACVGGGSCVVYSGRGERCGQDAECGWGWACIDGACGPAPAIGSPCASSVGGATCTRGAYCDRAGTPATCRAQKAGGATCTDYVECASYACTAGKCDAERRVCTP